MTQDQFTNTLVNMVDAKIAELLTGKPADKKSINFFDAISISSMIKNVFIKRIEKIPPQIEALCNMCEAILAPTVTEKKKRIKAILGIGGTVSGLGMIIGGIGTALGWGAGVITAVTAFFVGTSLMVPGGFVIAGVTIAAICGYLALSGDEVVDSERYISAFKDGLLQAIPSIWQENGEQLSK